MASRPTKGNPRKYKKNEDNIIHAGEQSAEASDLYSEKKVVRTKVSQIKKEARSREKKAQRSQAKERRKKEKRQASKLKIVLFTLLGAVATLAISFVILANTTFFEIDEVEYVGATHLTNSECEALAPAPYGQNLLTFDAAKIEAGLKRDSWVKNVEFKREFPHKLKIVVEEQAIGAVVDFSYGKNQISQSWIITLQGKWIMGIPNKDSDVGRSIASQIYTDSENAIHITDCPNGIDPKIGAMCTDDTVLNAIKIISGFTTNLKDNVKTISASNINATTLKLKNNIEVAFGQADQIRDKERICNEIMNQNSKVVYINVRSTDRPTWRSA